MSAEAIMNQAIKAVPTPVIDPQDLCNPDWQSPLDNDFSVVGPFSETEGHANNHPHGGIDIAAKEKEVKAVTDGYIDEVKNMNRNSRDGPIYTLVQVSTQGDAIIYLHLTRGRSSPETDSRNGIQFCNKDANGRNTDCLADEPNILDHWKEKAKDPAKAKYKVKQGDVLAISGNTGAPNGTYHLHLEYLPIGNTHPQWKRNPLCRLAQLVAKPSTINLPAKNPGDDTTSLRLMDKTGSHEYLVRRQKHPKPEVFLSSAASPMPPETDKCKLTTPLLMCFDFLSRTVMVLTSQRTIADPSIASIDATYKDPGETRISTDNGKVHLLPGNNTGSTILKVKPEIIWNAARSGNDVVSLGSDVTVQINNALPPVPASPAPTPADKDCVVTDNGLLTKPNQSPVVGLTVQMVKNSAGCSLPLAPNGIGMPPNPANLPSLQPVAQVPFHPFKDPTHGSISIVNGHFFYKPDQDYVGTDSFTLNYTQVTADGHGQVGPDQQVQVTISP
jgi:hypothetical protein